MEYFGILSDISNAFLINYQAGQFYANTLYENIYYPKSFEYNAVISLSQSGDLSVISTWCVKASFGFKCNGSDTRKIDFYAIAVGY